MPPPDYVPGNPDTRNPSVFPVNVTNPGTIANGGSLAFSVATLGMSHIAVAAQISNAGSIAVQRYFDLNGSIAVGSASGLALSANTAGILDSSASQLAQSAKVTITNGGSTDATISALQVVLSGPASPGTPPSETHTYGIANVGTQTLTMPAWCNGVYASGVGPGGPGAGGQLTSGAGGGGGGSGSAVSDFFLPVTPGSVLTIVIPGIANGGTIGAAGTASGPITVSGFAGPVSTLQLNQGSPGQPGSGGTGGAGGAGAGVGGGTGGAAGAIGNTGTISNNWYAGNGGTGGGSTAGNPGANSAVYSGSPFARASGAQVNGNGGPGANSLFGTGGAGGNAAAGADATAPGVGGGGGAFNFKGGNGGPPLLSLRLVA